MAGGNSLWAAIFLPALFIGVDTATVTLSGTTTVTELQGDIDLICSFTLVTNETAQSLTLKKGSELVVSWTNPATTEPIVTPPWTKTSSSGTSVTAKLPKESVARARDGIYTCTVTSTGTSPVSKTHTVAVNYKPDVPTSSGSTNVVEGKTLTVTCSAVSKPGAQYAWTRNGQTFANNNQLQITNAARNQKGTYICTATNSVGNNTLDISVTVYYLDTPQMSLSSDRVAENGNFTIICSAVSLPTAEITISGSNGRTKTCTESSGCNFSFNPGCLDAGEYTCGAKTSQISSTKTTKKTLSVLCKPRNDDISGETNFVKNLTDFVVLSATLMAYPPPKFQWTRIITDTNTPENIRDEPGHFNIINTDYMSLLNVTVLSEDDYAEYNLKAVNDQGETTLKYYLRSTTKPYQVSTLSVANVTTDSITVMWSSSFNGGATQQYFMQYLPMGERQQNAWTQKTVPISDPGRKQVVTARISDIHPGRTYRVRIFSKNQFGQSEYSNTINVTTSELPSQVSFGIGIVIGIVITILLCAAAVGGFIFYRRRHGKKGDGNNRDYTNRAFNTQSSEGQAGALYTSLEGERAKPQHYDDLNQEHAVYQNVDPKSNRNGVSGASVSPAQEVYMNFSPDEAEPKRKFGKKKKLKNNAQQKIKDKNLSKQDNRPQAYENTAFDGNSDLHNNNDQTDSQVYANT